MIRELRIGNLVLNEDGLIHQVDGVNSLGVTSRQPNIKEPFENAHVDRYKPIPLTEEWLVRLGFVGSHSLYKIDDGKFYFSINIQTRVAYINDGEGYEGAAKILYVHQLQNLYFALTGQELVVENL